MFKISQMLLKKIRENLTFNKLRPCSIAVSYDCGGCDGSCYGGCDGSCDDTCYGECKYNCQESCASWVRG